MFAALPRGFCRAPGGRKAARFLASRGLRRYILSCDRVPFHSASSQIRAREVPAGDGWLHEVKFDGYRVQVHKVGSRVVVYSRNGHDFTERFPSIAQMLHELPAKAAVLDGEPTGRPNFARRHVRWTRPGTIHLWAFDLLAFQRP